MYADEFESEFEMQQKTHARGPKPKVENNDNDEHLCDSKDESRDRDARSVTRNEWQSKHTESVVLQYFGPMGTIKERSSKHTSYNAPVRGK